MEEAVFSVLVEPLGEHFAAPATSTLLEAGIAAGLSLPHSCRNGSCRTCRCYLLSGSIAYRIEWPGLSLEEKAEGMILPCVAYPQSDLVISAPLAWRP